MTIGFAITGSFCTHERIKGVIKRLVEQGIRVIPIYSYHVSTLDHRFGTAQEFTQEIDRITGEKGIYTIPEAEPIGPQAILDLLVIAPCTGNTMAKLNHGITDTPVLMAAKAHLRNERPIVISISTNDAMGINFRNLGDLYNRKYFYFVPFGQDHPEKKTCSLVANVDLIPETIQLALQGKQIQPILC